jgi:hypothetical protein
MNKSEYLLVCLMEECAEVQQIAAKCLRFGLDNYHPSDEAKTPNYQELRRELNDLDGIRIMLHVETRLPFEPEIDQTTPMKKINKVRRYMEVSRGCGTLE